MLKSLLSACLLIPILAGTTMQTDKKIIYPPGAKPGGNWSYGIVADRTLYISGMGGEDASGKIPATFEAEVQQSLDNIGTVLKAAGMSSADVVSVQVYLTDRNQFASMNKVYASYFKDPRPTRTTVIVAGLVGDGHIEITATAKK